jgi:hypothetical protein
MVHKLANNLVLKHSAILMLKYIMGYVKETLDEQKAFSNVQ